SSAFRDPSSPPSSEKLRRRCLQRAFDLALRRALQDPAAEEIEQPAPCFFVDHRLLARAHLHAGNHPRRRALPQLDVTLFREDSIRARDGVEVDADLRAELPYARKLRAVVELAACDQR